MPEEKIYIVPLRKTKDVSRKARAERAVGLVRDFLKRHMRSEHVIIDQGLNEHLWGSGIQKPCSKVRVRAVKEDDGTVKAFLAE